MKKQILSGVVLLAAALAAPGPAAAQGRLAVEPSVGWGFFGTLPDTRARLEGGWAYGARAAIRPLARWGVYGHVQRSRPQLLGQLPFTGVDSGDRITVEHWSAGLEYSYHRWETGAEALPLVLQAGIGRTSYEGGPSDAAVSLGVSGGVPFAPGVSLRYGINDYLSNYDGGAGWVNQVFARIGLELSL
ncbi:MAG TPA: hypothetical protein VHG51_12655 [Longimicrobiaceae bacterium]|nr:hypothetical protein [Longimicrobiaceae bacterium]